MGRERHPEYGFSKNAPYSIFIACLTGLQRVRDSLLSQLRELNKSKPRNNADEALLAEVTRLESSLSLAKEDLVRRLHIASVK